MRALYTITNSDGQVRYAGNGVTTAFSVTFQFFEASTLRVRTAIGSATTLRTLGVDYMVSGGDGGTGVVTFVVAPPTGTNVLIDLNMPITQETIDLSPNGPLPAEDVEQGFDRIVTLVKQLAAELSIVPRMDVTFDPSAGPAPLFPPPEAGKLVAGNAGATGWENVSPLVFPGTIPITLGAASTASQLALHADGQWRNVHLIFDVKSFGAAGDGVANDYSAIIAAVQAANAAGGGTVYFPPGTYVTGSTIAVTGSNVHLMGAGRGAVVVRLADGVNSHVINLTSITDCSVTRLTVDGNRAGQVGSQHGIRLASATRSLIQDVRVINAGGYSIGAQTGTFDTLIINNVEIEGGGGDGIDIKNHNDDNTGLIFNNVTVKSYGQNLLVTQFAALDIRGPANLSNISIEEVGIGNVGVRFRQSGNDGGTGLGGHQSNLSNFRIKAGPSISSGTIGITIAGKNIAISNGYIEGVGVGVRVQSTDNVIANVTVKDVSTVGFDLGTNGTDLISDRAQFIGCTVDGSDERGYIIAAVTDCRIIGGAIRNCTQQGILVGSGATAVRVIGTSFAGNGSVINDSGTDTRLRSCPGYITEARGTATIPNGATFVAVNHGLAAAPTSFSIVPRETIGSAKTLYVSTVGASVFHINSDVDPGKDVLVGWTARTGLDG